MKAEARSAECGDIIFFNSQQAYDDLSVEMKAQLAGLEGKFCRSQLTNTLGANRDSKHESQDCAVHPLVTTHPVTGRRSLYANPAHTTSIVGMDDRASEKLLHELFQHTAQQKYVFRQSYGEGDVVIWDNRGNDTTIVLHLNYCLHLLYAHQCLRCL